MWKKLTAKAIAFAVVLFLAVLAHSHDIWLYTEQFTPGRGDTLTIRQLVGSDLAVDMELELLTSLTSRFELISPDSSVDLLAEIRDKFQWIRPVFERKVDFDGLALIAMDHHFIYTELPHHKFLEYLEHEGLKIKDFQSQMGKRSTQSERYARSFKCLVQVGEEVRGEQYKQVVGQKLEILLLQNPYLLNRGDVLEVQILFDGQPLAKQLVTSFNGDGRQLFSTTKARTDKKGVAKFRLSHEGFYLIRLMYLFPCSDPHTDWESHWSTYSFELN